MPNPASNDHPPNGANVATKIAARKPAEELQIGQRRDSLSGERTHMTMMTAFSVLKVRLLPLGSGRSLRQFRTLVRRRHRDPVHLIRDKISKHGIRVLSSNYTLYGDMQRRVIAAVEEFACELEIYSIDAVAFRPCAVLSAERDRPHRTPVRSKIVDR